MLVCCVLICLCPHAALHELAHHLPPVAVPCEHGSIAAAVGALVHLPLPPSRPQHRLLVKCALRRDRAAWFRLVVVGVQDEHRAGRERQGIRARRDGNNMW